MTAALSRPSREHGAPASLRSTQRISSLPCRRSHPGGIALHDDKGVPYNGFSQASKIGLFGGTGSTLTALILRCGLAWSERRFSRANRDGGHARQANEKAPPIPNAGPLARPRSLHQVGLPAELTREVIPQTIQRHPRKSLSVRSCSSMAACQPMALWLAPPAMIPRWPSPTAGRCRSCIHGSAGQRNASTILNALYNRRSSGTAGPKRWSAASAVFDCRPYCRGVSSACCRSSQKPPPTASAVTNSAAGAGLRRPQRHSRPPRLGGRARIGRLPGNASGKPGPR
jgi:hypothetical protein